MTDTRLRGIEPRPSATPPYRDQSHRNGFKFADRCTNIEQYAPPVPILLSRDMKGIVLAGIVMFENGLKIAIYNLCG